MKTRALWIQNRHDAQLRDFELPETPDGFCLVKTHFSAVSPGTEKLVHSGIIDKSLEEKMKCPYMEGKFSFPVKYGYSAVGEVIAGSIDLIGEYVHFMHPHQEYCIVKEADIFPIPLSVPLERAVLTSNLETAVNAIWDGGIYIGCSTLIIGFGVIGSLVARLASMVPAIEMYVYDISGEKSRIIDQMRFNSNPVEKIDGNVDIAFNASGSGNGLQLAIDSVGFEGKIVDLSWYGAQPANLNLGGTFHSDRKMIISSQVSNVSRNIRNRWDKRRRKKLVFKLLEDKAFDAHNLHAVDFTELPDFYKTMAENPKDYLSVLVKYGNSAERTETEGTAMELGETANQALAQNGSGSPLLFPP